MNDINVFIFSGRLTADSEVKRTKSGKPLTIMSVATNDDYKLENEKIKRAYFFSVVIGMELQIPKGTQVLVEGKMTQKKVEKEEDKRVYYSVVATKVIAQKQEKKETVDREQFDKDYEDLQRLRAEQKQAKQKEEMDSIDESFPF